MRGLEQQAAIHLGQSGQIFQQLIGVCILFILVDNVLLLHWQRTAVIV
jgi:hypothetical protein